MPIVKSSERLIKTTKTLLKTRYVLLFLLFSAYSAVFLSSVSGQQSPNGVIIANFDVPVDPGSSAFIARVFNQAIQQNASAVIIEMNTPGGLLSDMLSIVSSITTANSRAFLSTRS